MEESKRTLIMVYGSLMQGLHNHGLLSGDGATFLGHCSSTEEEFAMVSAGSFPFLIDPLRLADPSKVTKTHIMGEIYGVDDDVLKKCDLLEGQPTWYKRRQIVVETWNGQSFSGVWIYVLEDASHYSELNNDLTEVNPVGDWRFCLELKAGKQLVFSFGSNSRAQLRGRVGNSSLFSRPAKLEGYERTFCLASGGWGGGGVATIAPSTHGGSILGSVVAFDDEELEILDIFEGGYRRHEFEIMLGKSKEKAIAYVAGSGSPSFTLSMIAEPSEEYLCAIHGMLGEHWPIDENHVHEIKSFEDGQIVHVGQFEFILPPRTIESLIVLWNLKRSSPWTMPSQIPEIHGNFKEAGAVSVEEITIEIVGAVSESEEDEIILRELLKL